jgi:hypothetical protein
MDEGWKSEVRYAIATEGCNALLRIFPIRSAKRETGQTLFDYFTSWNFSSMA